MTLHVIFLAPLALSLGLAGAAHARCAESARYQAVLRVVNCEEPKPGAAFFLAEILDVAKSEGPHEGDAAPVAGRPYRVFLGLGPLIADAGGLRERPKTACLKQKRGSKLKGYLSRPCCDPNHPYSYCDKRKIDFIFRPGAFPSGAR